MTDLTDTDGAPELNRVLMATYDAQAHAALPGVEAPLVAYAPGGHLHPGPGAPVTEVLAPVVPEPEPDPTPEPAAPAAAREPVREPAPDGQFARGYL